MGEEFGYSERSFTCTTIFRAEKCLHLDLSCTGKNHIKVAAAISRAPTSYRVTHLLATLGWVDFDLGSSPDLLGQ